MRITERALRLRVRRVMSESFHFTAEIDESSMPFFKNIWDKIMDIASDLETSLVENDLAVVQEGAREVLDDLVQKHGDIKFDLNRFPGNDLLLRTGIRASWMMMHNPVYEQRLEKIKGLMVLMRRMLLKKSAKLDPDRQDYEETDLPALNDVILSNIRRYVDQIITNYASAIAIENLTGESTPGFTVLARNNPRFNLDKLLNDVAWWATAHMKTRMKERSS